MEFTTDLGITWSRTGPLNDGVTTSAIQPSILFLPDGRLQLVCRSENGYVLQAFSADNGHTWTALEASSLVNPNSGIDAVTLKAAWVSAAKLAIKPSAPRRISSDLKRVIFIESSFELIRFIRSFDG